MNTRARIATVCQNNRYFRTVAENRSYIMGLLDATLALKPDLVCLPETFSTAGVPGQSASDLAEPVPGPTIDAAAERAHRGHCYVLCPLFTRRGDVVYNSAVMIDRLGDIIGIYDKLHPVTSSPDYTVMESGVTPGAGDGIFDLDFGRVAVRICFDIGFPEDWESLARQDVRLVFWPSAYNGGNPLAVYAALHHFYVVSAVSLDRSRIIDPCGITLASTDKLTDIIYRDINLDFAVCHSDFNYSIGDRIRADYGDRVEVRTHVDDGLLLVEPTDPAVTIADLQSRYGFEDSRQYFQRHRDAYRDFLIGKTPPPQTAAHGTRPAYSKSRPDE